jgi:hypothetical protein
LGDGGDVAAHQLASEALGDGCLTGEHRGEGVNLLPRALDPDEGDGLRVGEGTLYKWDEERRVLAVQMGGEGDDHMTAGEHLAPCEVTVVSQDDGEKPTGVLQRHRPSAAFGGLDRLGQPLDRPAGGFELRSPPAHQLSLCLVLFGRPGRAGGHTSRPV